MSIGFGEGQTYLTVPVFGQPGSQPAPVTVPAPSGGAINTKITKIPAALPNPNFSYAVLSDRLVRFTNQSTGAVRYLWSFGDGQSATTKDPYHQYQANGSYTVKLRAYNGDGIYADYSAIVAITTVIPKADFTFYVSGLTVHFTDTSTTTTGAWHWDFGDGVTSTDKNPSHTYALPGTYAVSLATGGYTKTANVSPVVPADAGVFESSLSMASPGGGIVLPWGIAVDASYIYAADSNGNKVRVYNRSTLAFVTEFGTAGAGNGQFNFPTGIAVDSTHIFVADQNNSRVQKFVKGTYAYDSQVGGLGAGTKGLTVDDKLYVADSSNNVVKIYNKSTLVFETSFGSLGAGDGQFDFPTDVAVDASFIYVSEKYNTRVQVFNKSTHAFVGKFGTAGAGDGQFGYIYGLDIDDTYVYASDFDNKRVQIFNKSSLTFVAKFGSSGITGDGKFYEPVGIAVDTANILVGDDYRHDIQLFKKQVTTGVARPQALFSASPVSGNKPLSVTFTNLTTGPSPTWAWEFGDGGTSAVQNPVHSFVNAGIYTVRLTATNAAGSSVYSLKIVVTEAITTTTEDVVFPPVASFTASAYSGTAPLLVNFTDTSTNTPTAWEWSIDGVVFSTSQNPSKVFTNYGTYVVKLKVTKDVWTSEFTRTILVTADANLPPFVTTFSASASAGLAPITVNFTAAATGSPTAWEWRVNGVLFSAVQNPSYKFTNPGVYTVTLTVTNAYGSTSVTMQIVVAAADIVPHDMPFYIGSQRIGYYLVDTNNHRVIVYERKGTYIKHFGGLGAGTGQFIQPTKLALIGGVQLLSHVETEL